MFYLVLLSLVGVFFLLSTYFLLTADPQNARSGRQFVTQPLYYGATLLPNPGLFTGVNPFNRGVVDMNAACLTPENKLVYWLPFLSKISLPLHAYINDCNNKIIPVSIALLPSGIKLIWAPIF